MYSSDSQLGSWEGGNFFLPVPWKHSAISGHIFGFHAWAGWGEDATGIQWAETRVAT